MSYFFLLVKVGGVVVVVVDRGNGTRICNLCGPSCNTIEVTSLPSSINNVTIDTKFCHRVTKRLKSHLIFVDFPSIVTSSERVGEFKRVR